VRIVVHDGGDTIGGNKISVCSSKGDCFLLDFGLNFSKWGNFFEEFLNPRTGRIIHDLLKLKLIPEIPIYREDIAPPQLTHDGTYKFVFLSHGHADHLGMAGLISAHIPFLATSETLAIAYTDSSVGNPKIWNSIYSSERIPPKDPLIRQDLKISKRKSHLERLVAYAQEIPEGFVRVDEKAIWDELKIFKVYHSVLGASALAAKVDGWWIVYTGDFRAGPKEEEKKFWLENLGERRLKLSLSTQRFIEEAKNLHPMVLIVEGTRVTRQERESEMTEKDVFDNSLRVISSHQGLVLVDFPVRHLERLFTFLKIAILTSRKLLLMPKDYAYLLTLQDLEPAWTLSEEEKKHLLIYHPGKVSYIKKEKEALAKAQEENIMVGPDDVNSSPESFIMAAGYFDMKEILDISEDILKAAIYIHSTSEAYTEEQEIDVKRFSNWLRYFSIKPLGIDLTGEKIEFTGVFHASGHIGKCDLEKVINILSPEVIVPVHTLSKDWFVQKWGAKVMTSPIIEI